MPTYSNKSLRKDILITIAYIPFSSFRVKAILNALRPTGYEELTETSLLAQIHYLERGGYLEMTKSENIVTGEEVDLVTITKKGIDLLEGNCTDIGVDCGKRA
jgi:hypothetical protein